MPNRTKLWAEVFSVDGKKAEILNRVRPKIEKKMIFQIKGQKIGKIREEKVRSALQALKDKKKIVSFLSTVKFGFADLIEGIDFRIIYVNQKYRILNLSVTGQRWAEEHRQRHPKIPVIVVFLKESRESIEKKILNLII